jgi:Rad3-related DNA helicase
MAFKRRSQESVDPVDPIQLYTLLPKGEDTPDDLWWHQGKVIETWHKEFSSKSDVAIELPTGSGKTLVGGLIGEYRRRKQGQRVVYLCTTNYLARQAYNRLQQYGIESVLLTGRTAEWNQADRARYTAAGAIAVSVYSHVFNSNPGLGDAEFMILDDAHAAEGAVSENWSMSISRKESPGAYRDFLALLHDALDPLVLSRLQKDSPDGKYATDVHLASPLAISANRAALEDFFSAEARSGGQLDDQRHSYRQMAGHIGRCLIFASYGRIQIRPFIPPTHTHPAFESPKQRLYMSATLGNGGELERSFGRAAIQRIPLPEDRKKKGTGRRFFCFPELTDDLSKDPDAVSTWVGKTVADVGRAVIATPDRWTAKSAKKALEEQGLDTLSASDVDNSLAEFTTSDNVALVLSNRYDGLDLPGEDCRLIVMDGLPSRGDLQERFLVNALGAIDVLQERIRARIVQGTGRATRHASDYAVVVMLGDDLTSFCTRRDVLDAMPTDINAEIAFGLDNSLGIDSSEMQENIGDFLNRTPSWWEADEEIKSLKGKRRVTSPPGTAELGKAAQHEVRAYQAAWQGEWNSAVESARHAIDALTGGRAPQRYSALWNYLAACWSLVDDGNALGGASRGTSQEYYQSARAAGRGTLWLTHLSAPAESKFVASALVTETDALDFAAASGIANSIQTVGKPSTFDAQISRMRNNLLSVEASPYEEGLVFLGVLLGASQSTGNKGATAAPDAIWDFGSVFWAGWEAKSNAQPRGELGATEVRQAGSHLRYHADATTSTIPSGSLCFVMTPQERVHPASRSVAEDHVYLVRNPTVMDLYDRAVRSWKAIRSRGLRTVSPQDVLTELRKEKVLPSMWLYSLTRERLANGSSLSGPE